MKNSLEYFHEATDPILQMSFLVVQKKVSGTNTTLGTAAFAASAGTSYSLRFQDIGTTLSANAWTAREQRCRRLHAGNCSL